MLREIVLDTETTGFDPKLGHRVIEIGCLELINHVPTGQHFHVYINPERDVPEDAFRVHGLSFDFLKNHSTFDQIGHLFLEFIEESPLVIHNAKFDMGFLSYELERMGLPPLNFSRAIDTLIMARKKFPGSPATLDALCKRFSVDNSARNKHGALLDAELLAQIYVELLGGKQRELSLDIQMSQNSILEETGVRENRPPRPHSPTLEEKALHDMLLQKLII